MKSCVLSEKLGPQKKKWWPAVATNVNLSSSNSLDCQFKERIGNKLLGTFVWYKSIQKVTWSKWHGLKRLINAKWKESWELLSDVVNMWALDQRSLSFTVIFSQLHFLGVFLYFTLDQRSLSFTVIFFSTTFPWLISYSFRRHRYD